MLSIDLNGISNGDCPFSLDLKDMEDNPVDSSLFLLYQAGFSEIDDTIVGGPVTLISSALTEVTPFELSHAGIHTLQLVLTDTNSVP